MSKTPAHKSSKVIRKGGSRVIEAPKQGKKSEKSEEKVNATSGKK